VRALHVLPVDRPIYHLPALSSRGVPFGSCPASRLHAASFLAHTRPWRSWWPVLLAGGRLAGDLEVVAFSPPGSACCGSSVPFWCFARRSPWPLGRSRSSSLRWRTESSSAAVPHSPVSGRHRVAGARLNGMFGDVIIYVEDVSASQIALHGLLVSDERDRCSAHHPAREGRLFTDEMNRSITASPMNGAGQRSRRDARRSPKDFTRRRPGPRRRREPSPLPPYALHVYDLSLRWTARLRAASRIAKPPRRTCPWPLHDKIFEFRHDAIAARRSGRVPQAIRAPLARSSSVSSPFRSRSLAPRRPEHRARRQPGHPGDYYLLMTSLGARRWARGSRWVAIWTPKSCHGNRLRPPVATTEE